MRGQGNVAIYKEVIRAPKLSGGAICGGVIKASKEYLELQRAPKPL